MTCKHFQNDKFTKHVISNKINKIIRKVHNKLELHQTKNINQLKQLFDFLKNNNSEMNKS